MAEQVTELGHWRRHQTGKLAGHRGEAAQRWRPPSSSSPGSPQKPSSPSLSLSISLSLPSPSPSPSPLSCATTSSRPRPSPSLHRSAVAGQPQAGARHHQERRRRGPPPAHPFLSSLHLPPLRSLTLFPSALLRSSFSLCPLGMDTDDRGEGIQSRSATSREPVAPRHLAP